jgi:hypothetical protein
VQQQSDALASWWRQLPPDAQIDLLGLSPAAQLPEDLTRELRSFGVEVADVGLVLRLGARSFAAYPQPPALREFLAAARIWAAIWAVEPD